MEQRSGGLDKNSWRGVQTGPREFCVAGVLEDVHPPTGRRPVTCQQRIQWHVRCRHQELMEKENKIQQLQCISDGGCLRAGQLFLGTSSPQRIGPEEGTLPWTTGLGLESAWVSQLVL